MAGNVTGLHVFTADVGPEALSLLDGNYGPLTTALNTLANFSNYYVDSGAVNALVVTTIGSQVFTYIDGVVLDVKVANTSTSTTPTLNVNALGAKTIVNSDGAALLLGALIAGGYYRLIYDGTKFRVRALPDSGSFTATITGCTTAPTGTANWARSGKQVTLALPVITATSNSTSMTYTGLPAIIQPATLTQVMALAIGEDSGGISNANYSVQIAAGSGTISFYHNGSLTGFTASGTKGLPNINTVSYLLT